MASILSACGSAAQTDPAYFNATLRDWEERLWLNILDRNGSLTGRFSDLGILQRFHSSIDSEYELDMITHRFSLAEDHEWYRRRSGIRWSGGSINKRDLASTFAFKTEIDVNDSWSLAARYESEVNAVASRNIFRFGLVRSTQAGAFFFGGGHLDRVKTGIDLTFGLGWRNEQTLIRRATLTVGVLDAFNNTFNALDGVVDSTQVYTKHPFVLRGNVEARLNPQLRVEAYGTYMRPATILRYEGNDESAGFVQDETYGYLGGLVEWAPLDFLRVGGFATYVHAGLARGALSFDAGVEGFDLTERTTQVGGFGMARFGSRVITEVWVSRTWRPENRIWADGQPGIEYKDQGVSGRAMASYQVPFGLVLEGGLSIDYREVVRGALPFPGAGSVAGHNRRGQLGVGWNISDQFGCRVAHRFDLDGDGFLKEGAVGRVYLYW